MFLQTKIVAIGNYISSISEKNVTFNAINIRIDED